MGVGQVGVGQVGGWVGGRSSWWVVGGGLVRQVGGRGQVDGWSGRWLVGQVAGGLLGGWVMAGLIGYIEHLNLVGVDVNFPLHVIFLISINIFHPSLKLNLILSRFQPQNMLR